MTLSELIAHRLKAVRLEKKLSQNELAKRSKLSVSYISMLERGIRTPPLDTLEKLAKALRVPPVALLRRR